MDMSPHRFDFSHSLALHPTPSAGAILAFGGMSSAVTSAMSTSATRARVNANRWAFSMNPMLHQIALNVRWAELSGVRICQ
jgi:hypothetical protein